KPLAQHATPRTPESRYLRIRSLTAMRRALLDDVDALIILGGRSTGYIGRYPGVVEEAALAVERAKPVFVLGGFGGAAACIGEALSGKVPEQLTSSSQLRQAMSEADGAPRQELVDVYNEQIARDALADAAQDRIDHEAVIKQLQRCGLAGLSNGLTDDQ